MIRNILLNGDEGVYHYTLNRDYTTSEIERIHTLLAGELAGGRPQPGLQPVVGLRAAE